MPALAGFLCLAAGVGVLATAKATFAFAIVVGAIVALVVARDVTALPLFLVLTMFVESLSLGPALRVGRVAGALALLVAIYYLLDRGRAGLRMNALIAAIGGWGAWALASVYWADYDGVVLTTLSSYVLGIAYTLAFALLVRRKEQLKHIYAVLAVGSLIFGAVSFLQYAAAGGGGTRSAGLQGDPNYFAVYQVIALAPTLVLAALERRGQRRLLLYGAVGVIVLSVVSSLSRTGVLALLAVVIATLVLPSRLFFARAGRKLAYMLSLVAAAVVAVGIGSTALVARLQSIFAATSSSGDRGAGRTDLWAAAWHGYVDHPWLGLGAGNFTPHALELLQTTPGVDTQRNYITTANVVHNGYLEQLTELGPVGLVLWLAILLVSARYLIRAARRARAAADIELERYAVAAVVALLGYAVSVSFLSNELGKPIWIFAGLALALEVMTRQWEPLLVAGRSYDRPVPNEPDEAPEERLERGLQALVRDQERLDRRRTALDERERELRTRERALASPLPPEPEPVIDDAALRRLASQVAALEKLLASRDRTIAELRARPPAPPARVEPPAVASPPATPAVPERVEQTPAEAPPPPPPAAVPPAPASPLVLEPAPGRWSLPALEQAMALHAEDPAAEEWAAYVLFLRDHVDARGVLPVSFDALVLDVFGSLIERVSADA